MIHILHAYVVERSIIRAVAYSRIFASNLSPVSFSSTPFSADLLLRIPEQRKLLLSNLDWTTTELPPVSFFSFHRLLARGRGKTYLRNQNTITLLHTHRYPLSILIETTGTNGQDLCFIEFLNGAFGQEDARCCLCLGFYSLNEDSVKEGHERADGFQGCSLSEHHVSRLLTLE